MTRREDVIALYAWQVNGIHRHNTEAFLELEAREKIFHLGAGGTALDFGCGSADLLVYYARHFDSVLGVDISANMLGRAQTRIKQFGTDNATLRQADDLTLWPQLGGALFDVITSAGVMQYFSTEQISLFVRNARAHLQPDGRVAMFDIVDPRIYWLFKYGWFSAQSMNAARIGKAIVSSARVLGHGLAKRLALRPRADLMGRTHHPAAIERLASSEGYDVTFVRSMYYEYRYHALLTPRA